MKSHIKYTHLVILLAIVSCIELQGQTIDLISLVDLDRDVVSGTWELAEGELISIESPPARISFPYRPPLEYDYTVEFTLEHDGDNTAQFVSHGDVPFTWNFPGGPGGGYQSRLEDINGHSVIGNPTLVPYDFFAGHRYTSTVRVRNDRVICEIDGEVLVEYETDYTDLSRNSQWEMPDQLNLGLGGYGSSTTFHSATVTVVPESLYEWYIFPENGHRYALTLEHSNWEDASSEARSLGGHLVTINDQAENDWLINTDANPFGLQYTAGVNNNPDYNMAWIGLIRVGSPLNDYSSWEWDSQQEVTYLNISAHTGEDIDYGTYGFILGATRGDAGTWNNWYRFNTSPSYFLRGIIEKDDIPQLIVKTPNGGEALQQNTVCVITWETDSIVHIGSVLLEYSTDNGETWETIDIVGNSGHHEWETPHVNSDQCLVRVSDQQHPVISDTSDGVFTVFTCQRELAGDLNNDCYVNFLDFAIMASEWAECGNPFDPGCYWQWIDLASLVDFDEHTVDAGWSQRDDGYVFSAGKPRAYVSLPYNLPGSYELVARMTIERSKETVRFEIPVADRYIRLDIKGDLGNTAAETATMMLSGLTPVPLTWPDDKIIVGQEYRYHFDIHIGEPDCRIRIMVDDWLLYSWAGNLSGVDEGVRPQHAPSSWIELETAYYTIAYFAELAALPK